MSSFSSEYDRLNKEQKLAVDTVEGPVMVVAGPGTGKTQVLAMRVASILKKTQAKPSNILCLTFSNPGTTAMRERLRKLIGADAYSVTVSTIHAFCDSIIRRNPQVFSDWAARTSMSDLQKYKAMQKIVDEVSGSSLLINPKSPHDRIPAILERIAECKREGKNLEELLKVADRYDEEMAGKSRKGTDRDKQNRLKAKKFREFIALFKKYQEFLEESGHYDYEDMILVVIKALAENDWLLASLHERYQYILVDEAQDLNGAQWKVIEQLTTFESVPHEPNFFLVGDDDQAIYRFQGANLEHMLAFLKRFPKAPVIVLTTNYRSVQTILDAAGRLIAKNEERLIGKIPGLKKDLKASAKEKGSEPMLLRPPSDAAEPWLIADLAEERIKGGVPPGEIAVLVQTNRELRPIYDVLRARKIPVVLEGKADLLSHSVVRQATTILRSLESDRDDPFLHALACDCFGCHPADIARVIARAREEKRRSRDILLELESTDISLSDAKSLLRARDVLLDLSQKEASRTVLETVDHLLQESGIAALGETLDPLDLAVIEVFFQYVKDRCLERPSLSMREFLHDLTFYDAEELGHIRLSYHVPHLVSSGVQILTAHHSKGLEFHTVILSSFREGHWDERRNNQKLSLPEDLLFGWVTDQKSFEKHQDERRVAYVAMTRAKRELIMLCPKEFSIGERARAVSPSAFFAEAGPLPEKDQALKDPERSSLLILIPPREPDSELRAYLKKRLETFALSPSSLTAFLTDPLEFRRVHLLGQPERFSEDSLRALGYGSAVHWALKEWAGALKEKKPFAAKEFLGAFEWNLRNRNVLTTKQQDDLFAQATVALPLYFESRLQGTKPFIHAVERDYRAMFDDPTSSGPPQADGLRGAGIPLKGKIDRIDLASDTSADAVIIDYKTGAPKPPSVIRGGLEAGKVSRTEDGANFRQLVFYSLLLEKAEPLLVPQAFSLEFIGERGTDPISRPFSILPEEKEDLRKLIREVWGKITALDFTSLT